MKSLVIIGVGGFAREVYWHAQNSLGWGTDFTIKGFLDGTVKLAEEEYAKLRAPLLGDVATYQIEPEDVFVIAIAHPGAKETIAKIMDAKGARWQTLIHKSAFVNSAAQLGQGVILCMDVGIDPDTVIGDHVMINAYSAVGHDSRIGDYTSIMGYVGITGRTIVGKGTYWGTGAKIYPGKTVGNGAIIGMGSVVIRNVKAGTTVFGNPAKDIDE